ncbi:hypothetical protein TcYC6_0070110 [Trypanosoma cruzi]|uniref:Uncharacterized protein n=2 Tax=Trypanosoma cruzi TaxID=5693 RepID=Q4E4S2_TRYCC|nr:hypothetical protein, conserved [Trypanosoma cruzi]EAN99778.1 hypothetical protein, conserved [Trypanosoma cruzi]KAF5225555.1 hypothetical protein ECC02_001319 [Trypanosoma cruzi]KAF8298836.1 hypothetical protein TcYC6_0070110 [Trypanosoma cruzi]|eukprot:XP_821629.1 hypothetical protein [Trypanosoma cruzi strain CL Brener]
MASRATVFQTDVLEWLLSNKASLSRLRKERYALEKGVMDYLYEFRDMFRDVKEGESKEGEKKLEGVQESVGSRSLSQFYESEELAKRMKWKRVTWDEDADYNSFSRRLLDNDNLLKNVPAFSFLSIHVTNDPSSIQFVKFPVCKKSIELGTLTNWALQERDPISVEKYLPSRKNKLRSAFTVDWIAGEVKVIDTASVQEVLTFLHTVAPRLQAVQLRMEEQQTALVENVQDAKIRVGAEVKFNEHDTTFWDDPKRKDNLDYVTPDDVEKFLQGLLKSAFLYRWFLKGQGLRVLPPGKPYFIDMEKKEIQIPANFAEFNWRAAHKRFEKIERIFSTMRAFWWLWFSLAMVIIGDVELF